MPPLDWRAEHEKKSQSAPKAFASDESRRKKSERGAKKRKKKRSSFSSPFLPFVPSPGTLHGAAGVRIDARSSSSSTCSLALYRRPYAMLFSLLLFFCRLRDFCKGGSERKRKMKSGEPKKKLSRTTQQEPLIIFSPLSLSIDEEEEEKKKDKQ